MSVRPILPALRRTLALGALAAAAACAPAAAPAGPAPAADPAVKRVRIVHTNDFHGRLLPQTPSWARGRGVGGLAVLAAHFDSAAARFDGPTVFVSAGDDMQGTAISNLSFGRSTIDAFNAAGYDVAAFGNHEFDWGVDTLTARVRQSRFPWLGANLYTAGTDAHPQWVRPWVMVDRRGVRTAVVGVALPSTPEIVVAGRTAGLDFRPAAPAIDRAVREARAAGADFVVVSMHMGAVCEAPGREPEEMSRGCEGEMMDVAAELAEPVDLILGGHTHRRVLSVSAGIPVVEAESYSVAYSVTDLERAGGTTRAVHRSVRVPWADEVTPDTAVARVVREWDANVRPITEREVVRFAGEMGRGPAGAEGPLGNLIADAFRAGTETDASLINNGSIRRELPAGGITYGMLYELQPFQNEMVVATLTGAQLRRALEDVIGNDGPDAHLSGITVGYDPAAPAGQRVRWVRRADGREVAPTDTLRMGISEFVAGGGDGYVTFRDVQQRRTGQVDLEILVEYLRAQPQPVALPAGGRWQVVR